MISLTVNGKPQTLDGETPAPQFLRSLDDAYDALT